MKKKIVFAILPEKGHINPYIGPAQELKNLGHEVLVVAPGDIREQIERAGLRFSASLIPEIQARPTHGKVLVDLIQDREKLHGWIHSLLLENLDEQILGLRKFLVEEKPNQVVIDPLYYAAAIAAHAEKIPWLSISNSLNPVLTEDVQSDLLSSIEIFSEGRANLFKAHGMNPEFRGCDILSPWLNVVFATEALIGQKFSDVHFVGPSQPLLQRGDEVSLRPLPNDKPIVYASFGSQIYYWPEIFTEVREACEKLGAHCVLSVGELIHESPWNEPIPHCDVYAYGPQLEILKRASVFITHGGANSVMEGMHAGVPLLLSPMCNDQFHQAHFVQKANVGKVVDLRRASVSEISDALSILLTDTELKKSVQHVSASYQINGSKMTADLIQRLQVAQGLEA